MLIFLSTQPKAHLTSVIFQYWNRDRQGGIFNHCRTCQADPKSHDFPIFRAWGHVSIQVTTCFWVLRDWGCWNCVKCIKRRGLLSRFRECEVSQGALYKWLFIINDKIQPSCLQKSTRMSLVDEYYLGHCFAVNGGHTQYWHLSRFKNKSVNKIKCVQWNEITVPSFWPMTPLWFVNNFDVHDAVVLLNQ